MALNPGIQMVSFPKKYTFDVFNRASVIMVVNDY